MAVPGRLSPKSSKVHVPYRSSPRCPRRSRPRGHPPGSSGPRGRSRASAEVVQTQMVSFGVVRRRPAGRGRGRGQGSGSLRAAGPLPRVRRTEKPWGQRIWRGSCGEDLLPRSKRLVDADPPDAPLFSRLAGQGTRGDKNTISDMKFALVQRTPQERGLLGTKSHSRARRVLPCQGSP